jgi:D-sedoheptulose 7-phosphate isomerase
VPDRSAAESLIDRRVDEVAASYELLRAGGLVTRIAQAAAMIVDAYRSGGKVVAFGNGGSAADAEHVACELVGRFERERAPLAALALTENTAALTAIANDYSYEHVFARQLRALGAAGDVAIAISTSGNSPNVLEAARVAREIGMKTIALTGADGGQLARHVDLHLGYPAESTPRVQEGHTFVGHVICEIVEDELFPHAPPK